MDCIIGTIEELGAEAVRIVGLLKPSETATLVTLSGELGAGKTAFTKAIAITLGVEEVVNSPTFVLEKIYMLPDGQPFKRLVHIDAYRLEKGSDLAALGFEKIMNDSENLVLLEWPEKVADALPAPVARISIVVQQDGSRILSYA